MMAGDFNLISSCGVLFLYFNQSILENNQIASPYEDAFNGAWTIDKMLTIVETCTADLDGNGIMDINDRWGFLSNAGVKEMLQAAVQNGNLASTYAKFATKIQKTLDSYRP